MNKELVEKMREAVENSYDRVPNTGIRLLNPTKVAEQCAAVASEHYGDKWVKVEERNPENTGNYLCITNDGKMAVCHVATNGWWSLTPDAKFYGDMGKKVIIDSKEVEREVVYWLDKTFQPPQQ